MKAFLTCIPLLFSCALGAQSPDSLVTRQVDSLVHAADIQSGLRAFDTALVILDRADQLMEASLSVPSATRALVAYGRAKVYHRQTDYPGAEPWYRTARETLAQAGDPDDKLLGSLLNNQANLYRDWGRLKEALSIYQEAVAARARALGTAHAEYAQTLLNMAGVYINLGDYALGEKTLTDAGDILARTLGKADPSYGRVLLNLANLYLDRKMDDKVEPLYLEAGDIFAGAYGRRHPEYGKIMLSLAQFNVHLGHYDRAIPYFEEARSIFEEAYGRNHPFYAGCLHGLASLYMAREEYDRAEVLLRETRAILAGVTGTDHPFYAGTLHNLALVCERLGRWDEVEDLYIESMNIRERVVGRQHPEFAASLNNLGNLYMYRGFHEDSRYYAKAEPLFLDSRAIILKCFGPEHPDYAESLLNLSSLYTNEGEYRKAAPYLEEASVIYRKGMTRASGFATEQELGTYLKKFSAHRDRVLGLLRLEDIPDLSGVAYDNCLYYKGFLQESRIRVRRLAREVPGATALMDSLRATREILAARYAAPVADRDSQALAGLETRADRLEEQLTRTVAGYGEAIRDIHWRDVLGVLKDGEVAVEFVQFQLGEAGSTDSTLYGAMVLRPGMAHPAFVLLFEAGALDSLLVVRGIRRADYVNRLYDLSDRGLVPDEHPCPRLVDLIWKPLLPLLEGARTIYFAPDALLHRLNLSAIYLDELHTAGSLYNLVRLGSTRQLVLPPGKTNDAREALLYGGIRFDPVLGGGSDGTRSLTRDSLDEVLKRGGWSTLSWTAREVSRIADVLANTGTTVQLRTDSLATEASFKRLGTNALSPRYIHLATHGYFFPDPTSGEQTGSRTSSGFASVYAKAGQPMIRSGLVMAGGNYAWLTGKPLREGGEDGILTAYEISQMNLEGTELVVLSACETGLGEIRANEGVYGLQRAFKLAGVRYVIMSLWQIPDQETAYFMEAFYRQCEALDGDIPAAFRETQRIFREDRMMTPYQWAGFVLMQ